ncbi:hypothetical protein HOY80DRAFT_897843, partial [Tuber brumale]
SVNNATLNRFFALHFVLPFVLTALVLMHLIALHERAGSLVLGPKFLYMKPTSLLSKAAVLSFIIPNTRANKRIGPFIFLRFLFKVYCIAKPENQKIKQKKAKKRPYHR